ncbi:hypothetical protein HNQ92_004550 [Rhabdobacter roseus]|uniref:Uncharacterized protein n=1 Tax=Rhabdobacter roseus TaxID=1655419 RepID=A0A840U2P0_9BACT|nr:hypothetical protein [Rhabdobacter roseus]MBB5286390.1 hypothetical protein [Rhabdobacter roseus]
MISSPNKNNQGTFPIPASSHRPLYAPSRYFTQVLAAFLCAHPSTLQVPAQLLTAHRADFS